VRAAERKMLQPLVAPRVEQNLHAPSRRIDPGQVRTLVEVTSMTAVLVSDHVLDVMCVSSLFL
jgi:hypothetical protein